MTIILDKVLKRYGAQVVVNNVSLTIEEGELFVLLGSSGSGKSTILRVIAGLVTPDSGIVSLRGVDVTHLAPQKRGVGFVFQSYALFRHLTVAQNIEFGLKIRGVSKSDRRSKRDELLELVGLSGLGERYPAQLSGGQSQRVALARALAYQPSVLLLDEPFGALDVKIRGRLRRSLKALQKQLGVTTVLVTHDQEEAFELANRIAVVERGRVIEAGTPHELYYAPRTEFTANFVGGGNVLFGRSKAGYVQLGAALLPLPPDSPTHNESAPVRVLSRPEWVQYSREDTFSSVGIPVLGRGTVRDRLFGGASEKVRFELDELKGLQSVGLSYEYGQKGTLVDSLAGTGGNAELPLLGEHRIIGLRRYHILQPSSLRILSTVTAGAAGTSALGTAAALASASHGVLSLLGIGDTHEAMSGVRATAQAAADALTDERRDLKVVFNTRIGSPMREVVLEAQEGYFDMVVLPSPRNPDKERTFSDVARHVLANARIPVLLVSQRTSTLKRVLICTAGGEPGMGDVRFAARMSRHTQAVARVFHARRPGTVEDDARVRRHIERAGALLTSFGVQNDCRVTDGDPVKSLLEELAAENWDLVVLGAPGTSPLLEVDEESFDSRILNGTDVPILIVPTSE